MSQKTAISIDSKNWGKQQTSWLVWDVFFHKVVGKKNIIPQIVGLLYDLTIVESNKNQLKQI